MTRNTPTDIFRSIDMSAGIDACWPWTVGLSSSGRPYFTANGVRRLAYHWVWELVKGTPVAKDKMLLHSCDNQICCNPSHLREGTHDENMTDMKTRERHGLPHNTVRAIKKLLREGKHTHQAIGELYGLSREQITHINNGRAYEHVKEEEA